jgi:anti-sigma B factor antagonist
VSAGIQRVAIDMSDVRFLTSAGIGALIHIDRACRAAGGRVVLFGLSDDLVGLLKISRLDKVFAIKSDEAAAIAALG